MLGTGATLILQVRGRVLASRLATQHEIQKERQSASEAVFEAYKRIIDGQDRRIVRLEQAEQRCQQELAELRRSLA